MGKGMSGITGEDRAGYRDHLLYAMTLGTRLREHELIALSVGDVLREGRPRVAHYARR